MAAYIDREASVESLNAMKPFLRDRGQVQLLRRVMNHIGKIPAADVVHVVHGRWEHLEVGWFDLWRCSACGDEWTFGYDPTADDLKVKYCPNCGARMDGE